jgi:hypothetical protein
MIIVYVKCLIIFSKRQLFLLFTHLNTQLVHMFDLRKKLIKMQKLYFSSFCTAISWYLIQQLMKYFK